MNLDFKRQSKGLKRKNPLLMTDSKEKKNDFRRNIKITDPIYYKIRALMKVTDLKQYELIDEMADAYVKRLTEQEKEFFDYQLEEITRTEEEKRNKKQKTF